MLNLQAIIKQNQATIWQNLATVWQNLKRRAMIRQHQAKSDRIMQNLVNGKMAGLAQEESSALTAALVID